MTPEARQTPNDGSTDAVARRRPSGEQLLTGFLEGQEAMFAELVQRYEEPLYGFICRLTGRPADAADAFQETFLRVFQKADTFAGRSSFKTWLYAIATNVCRARLRAAQRHPERSDPPEQAHLAAPNGHAISQEVGERIARAVGRLPTDQREVFLLKTYEELSYPQIARALGRPLGTVKSQMRLALAKLRTDLHEIAEAYGLA